MGFEVKSQTKMERLEKINQEIVGIETRLLKSSIKKPTSEIAILLAKHKDKRDKELKSRNCPCRFRCAPAGA